MSGAGDDLLAGLMVLTALISAPIFI